MLLKLPLLHFDRKIKQLTLAFEVGGKVRNSGKLDTKKKGAIMAEPIHHKIIQSLQTAECLYHRLVLLVGNSGSGKTGVLRDVAEQLGTSVININLSLSSELLELTSKQRSLRLPEIFGQVADKAKPPLVLDNLEILFDKDLKQDPLRLLQGISRNFAVVASWNGTIRTGRLLYAEAGHPEYRSYDSVDAQIVDMESK